MFWFCLMVAFALFVAWFLSGTEVEFYDDPEAPQPGQSEEEWIAQSKEQVAEDYWREMKTQAMIESQIDQWCADHGQGKAFCVDRGRAKR